VLSLSSRSVVWFTSAAHGRCVLRPASWYSAPSTKICTSRIQSLACFGSCGHIHLDCLARSRCQWTSTGYIRMLSFSSRSVVWFRSAAHGRCVLVQRAIHKNLHFKNSITRLFRQLWPYSFRLPRPHQCFPICGRDHFIPGKHFAHQGQLS
jgi:hypothetical protein